MISLPNESDITIVLLPPSTMNKLFTVSQVSDDNVDTVPVARSYDGLDYDTLHPLLLSVDCVEGSCSVELPPNTSGSVMHYIIKEFSPDVKTDKEDKARLLLQATYGPTEESLAEAVALGSPADWVQDQINKPATLLRSHYRHRTNGLEPLSEDPILRKQLMEVMYQELVPSIEMLYFHYIIE